MKKINSLSIIFFLPIIGFCWINWKTLENERFQLVYKPGFKQYSEECLKVLEYYQKDVVNLTDNKLGKIPIVIEDIGIISNGYTDPIFQNIHLFTYSPESFSELGFLESWWRMVSIHEYTHMAHLTKMGGIPTLLTALLGTFFQPNIWSPFWLIEGVATFSESQISPYEGRLNDGFFDAYISAYVSEGKFPSLLDITYLPFDYPYGNGRYIYGGKFIKFLAEKFGKERFAYFFKNKGSSILSYFDPLLPFISMDNIVSNSFFSKDFMFLRRDFPFLFERWKYYETKMNKLWQIDGERLTKKGEILKFLFCQNNKLYYVRERTIKTGAAKVFWFTDIVEYDLAIQKENNLVSLTTYVNCPLKIINSKIYYSTLDTDKGYANTSYLGYGFIASLHQRDLRTKKDRIILKDNFRSFAVLPDGRILYSVDKKEEFGSKLFLYSPEIKRKEEFLNTQLLISEIVASDKYIVTVARKDWESWDIYFFDINSKTFTPIIKTPYKESSIFLKDDKIFFIANYDKIYVCYAYDFVTKNLYKLTDGGYANFPVYNEFDSTLYFIGISSKGNDLYKKKTDFKINFVLKEHPANDYPQLPDLNEKIKEGGYFHVLKTLFPAIHIPLIFPIDTTLKSWGLGGYLIGNDAVGEHNYGCIFLLPTYANLKPYFNGIYNSYFLLPLVATFEFDNYSPYFSALLTYPVFYKLDASFSYLQISLKSRLFDTIFSRKIFSPYIVTEFNYPKIILSLAIAYNLERKKLGSSINRNGVTFIATIRRYIKYSEIDAMIRGFYDPDNPEGNGPLTRDPFDPFYAKSAVTISIDYSFPFLKIRNGMWNPNFYFEDLCISFFSDFAYSDKRKNQFFIGSEIKLEVGLLFQDALRIIPKIGLGVDGQRHLKGYFGLDISSYLRNRISPKQKIRDFIEKDKKRNFCRWENLIFRIFEL